MGLAYLELLGGRRELMLQLQAFAAAGEEKLRPAIRESFLEVMDDIRRQLGDADPAALFMARGMLLNILTALDAPERYWPAPLPTQALGEGETSAA
jgi:hypothetical protein